MIDSSARLSMTDKSSSELDVPSRKGFLSALIACVALSVHSASFAQNDVDRPSPSVRFKKRMVEMKKFAGIAAADLFLGPIDRAAGLKPFPLDMEVPQSFAALSEAPRFRVTGAVPMVFEHRDGRQTLRWSAQIVSYAKIEEASKELSARLRALNFEERDGPPLSPLRGPFELDRKRRLELMEGPPDASVLPLLFARSDKGTVEEVYLRDIEPLFNGGATEAKYRADVLWAVSTETTDGEPTLDDLRMAVPFFFKSPGATFVTGALPRVRVRYALAQTLFSRNNGPSTQMLILRIARAEILSCRNVLAEAGFRSGPEMETRTFSGRATGTEQQWTSNDLRCTATIVQKYDEPDTATFHVNGDFE